MKNELKFLLRNKRILIMITVLLTVTVLFTIVKYVVNGKGLLVSPGVGSTKSDKANVVDQSATQKPAAAAFDPPQEINYDSSTDLQKELDSVDPKVFDSDFGT